MTCPYFEDAYVGVCNASHFTYVPSISEMERYCFKENYRSCPTLGSSPSQKETTREDDKRKPSSIFLRPNVFEKTVR